MNRSITTRLNASTEQLVFWAIITATIGMMALYVYFISASVINIVLRKEMLLEISAAHSRIGNLESEYLAVTNTIDAGFAATQGFAVVEEPYYVSQAAPGNLTLNR